MNVSGKQASKRVPRKLGTKKKKGSEEERFVRSFMSKRRQRERDEERRKGERRSKRKSESTTVRWVHTTLSRLLWYTSYINMMWRCQEYVRIICTLFSTPSEGSAARTEAAGRGGRRRGQSNKNVTYSSTGNIPVTYRYNNSLYMRCINTYILRTMYLCRSYSSTAIILLVHDRWKRACAE